MVGGSRAVVALALGGWLMGSAAWAAEKTVVVLGTATPGGGFPVYGAAVADIINETDPTLAVQTRNTKGSTENVPLLEAGELGLAPPPGEEGQQGPTRGRPAPGERLLLGAPAYTPRKVAVPCEHPAPPGRAPVARAPPVVGGFGGLHQGAPPLGRRGRLSRAPRPPPGGGGPARAPASGARDDGDEHDRCRSARGPRPPRCPALPSRDRNRTLTRSRLPTAQDAMPTTRHRVTHA